MQRAKDALTRAVQWAAILVPAIGGAWAIARSAAATKLDVQTYHADRRADSLVHVGEQRDQEAWRQRIDHRTHVTLCRVAPHDSECEP